MSPSIRAFLPGWLQGWLGEIQLLAEVVLILVVAWLLRLLTRRLLARLGMHYTLPPQVETAARRLSNFVIGSAALVAILDQLGVSPTILWTAFTGFAAVGAVAFFAAWSVLSNIFCALLIFTTRPFRLGDRIELLENGEKPGLKGRVVDINLIYTTLLEVGADASDEGSVLQVPNSLFFQRTVRRWRGQGVPARWLPPAPSGDG